MLQELKGFRAPEFMLNKIRSYLNSLRTEPLADLSELLDMQLLPEFCDKEVRSVDMYSWLASHSFDRHLGFKIYRNDFDVNCAGYCLSFQGRSWHFLVSVSQGKLTFDSGPSSSTLLDSGKLFLLACSLLRERGRYRLSIGGKALSCTYRKWMFVWGCVILSFWTVWSWL